MTEIWADIYTEINTQEKKKKVTGTESISLVTLKSRKRVPEEVSAAMACQVAMQVHHIMRKRKGIRITVSSAEKSDTMRATALKTEKSQGRL